MALPFIGTGTATTGAAGAGTTIAGATASTVAAGAGIGMSALAAAQGLYDTFANPDGVVYGEDGQIRDYTRSAKIGAWLTGSQLTPIENLTYTPLKASSSNIDVTQLRKELTANANNPEKQLALLTKFFATAEGKQLLAANGLPDSIDKLGAEIQGMLDSGKSTEEVFQHFLGMYSVDVNLIKNKESGDNAIEDLVNKRLPGLGEDASDDAKVKRKQARDGFRKQLRDVRSAILNDEASKKGGGSGGKDPKKNDWMKVMSNILLFISYTGLGAIGSGLYTRSVKNAQIQELSAESTKEFKKLQDARLSNSITKVRNAYVALKDQKGLSSEVKEGLDLIAPRLKSLQKRFNSFSDRANKDKSYYSECKAIYNLLTLLLQKHNQQNSNSPFNEITAFTSIDTIINLKEIPEDIDNQLLEAKKPFQTGGEYVGEWTPTK